MKRQWSTRLFFGLLFALPAILLSVALTQASALPQADTPAALDCKTCHTDFEKAWQSGAHGQAASDPAFKETWKAQGSPAQCLACHTTGFDMATGLFKADGVTCEACHSPINDKHPQEPMPAERSAQLCGTCHTETFFEWQVSKHREVNLACVGCHDSHGTTLKAESASKMCATCHRERASNFAHSQHSQVGLTCADCHLTKLGSGQGEGHATRDHSFNVKLSACNQCHAYQMHDPAQVHPDQPTPAPVDAMASVETLSVSAVPEQASPVGFATVSGLVGFAAGIILAPWLERWYRRNNHRGDK
ncbi:MAG TPA: cytochrome c3 family protein [Anaerolineae bacterium]